MKHRYAARNENKNATELQGCKLRVAPKILATVYCRGDFYKNATRNFGCASVFSSAYVQPCRWVLFFYFLLYYI